jgi:hypothetical protein
MNGQTITTVIERSIMKAADATKLDGGDFSADLTWHDFWDVSEGVRALDIARERRLYPSFEEDRRLAFVREHWPFFFVDEKRKIYRRYSVDVLWPRIDEFIDMHEAGRAKDYFGAGKAMGAALKAAGLEAPEWPQPVKAPKPPPVDLDDEIPF